MFAQSGRHHAQGQCLYCIRLGITFVQDSWVARLNTAHMYSHSAARTHSLAACHAAQAHRMGCCLTQTWLLAFGSAGSNWNVLIIYDGSVRLYALSHIDIIPHPVRFLCLHDKSITSCYRPAKQTHAAQPALELLSDNASPCRR